MSRIFGGEIAGRKTLMINYGTLITEVMYMSQVIGCISHSGELLVDWLNYYVGSNSADLLVIPLKYNLFSEFEGNSLVNWMNMYHLDNSLVIQENN